MWRSGRKQHGQKDHGPGTRTDVDLGIVKLQPHGQPEFRNRGRPFKRPGELWHRAARPAGWSLMEDGRYYAGTDGAVNPRRELGESEWEKLGRELRQSWDHLMKGTQDAAQDLEKGTERAVEKAENRM